MADKLRSREAEIYKFAGIILYSFDEIDNELKLLIGRFRAVGGEYQYQILGTSCSKTCHMLPHSRIWVHDHYSYTCKVAQLAHNFYTEDFTILCKANHEWRTHATDRKAEGEQVFGFYVIFNAMPSGKWHVHPNFNDGLICDHSVLAVSCNSLLLFSFETHVQ